MQLGCSHAAAPRIGASWRAAVGEWERYRPFWPSSVQTSSPIREAIK